MGFLDQIVIDCRSPSSLARFWESVLDDFVIRAYDDAEIARLAGLGFTVESDPTVMLDGPGLSMCFQRCSRELPGQKRMLHLDVRTSDRSSETSRLTARGAAVIEVYEGHTWMRDPEGNDFCLTDA